MAGNKNQAAAKAGKNDEFYTQLPDIENELMHYTEHFRGKTVLCNCDDPYESNFFKYFAMNFNQFGLKKLICTCYDGSPMSYSQTSFISELFGEKPEQNERKAYLLELTEVKDVNGDGAVDLRDVDLILQQNPPTLLKGNGDFRSPECIELLKGADIVVTNPPFSLLHEYVSQLFEYGKSFLFIGPVNALKYAEIFPRLMNNTIWTGFGFNKSFVYKTSYVNELEANRKFVISKGYDPDQGYIKNPAQCWFTNLEYKKRHEPLDLYMRFSPELYPHYDNYDAIEVDEVNHIPMDYDGVMGVPLTYIGKHCPDQFEILGCTQRGSHDLVPDTKKYDEYKEIIRATNKPTGSSGNKTNENAMLKGKGDKKHYFKNEEGDIVYSSYERIFIRKRKAN